MDSATLRRAMRLSIADGALATVMGTLTGGMFLTGLALALGASRLQIGILAAIPPLANVAQLIGSYWIEQTGQRKSICVWSTGASRVMLIGVAALPLLSLDFSAWWPAWVLVGLLGVSAALASIGGVAWLSWTKDLVPEKTRVGFLSQRNQINNMLSLSLAMIGGLFVDAFNKAHSGSALGFVLVIAFAILAGMVSLGLLAATPDAPTHRHEVLPSFGNMLSQPLKETNFRRVVLFYACWNLSVNMAAPFFAVFMLQKLNLSFSCVTVLATLASVSGLVANRFWTRLTEKFGIRPVVFLATLGDAFVPLAWLFATADWIGLLILIHLSGVFNAPLALGPNNMMFKLAPRRTASPYLAVFNAVVGPTMAAAAIFGGFLASSLDGLHYSAGGMEIGALKIIFFLSFCGRLASLLMLRAVQEPFAAPVPHVLRVLYRTQTLWLASRVRRLLPAPTGSVGVMKVSGPASIRSAMSAPPELFSPSDLQTMPPSRISSPLWPFQTSHVESVGSLDVPSAR